MDNQRLILFVVLGFLFLMLWQSWVEYSTPEQPVQLSGESVRTDNSSMEAIPETPEMASDATGLTPGSVSPIFNKKEEGKPVSVETDLLIVELNTLGAGINKLWLKDYTVDIDHPEDL